MTMTLQEIGALLKEAGINFGFKEANGEELIVYNFTTQSYFDEDTKEKKAAFAIRLEEYGGYIKIFSPRLYMYKDGPNKQALLQALLMVCWKTKLVEYEYDERDGEIRIIVEFPLEDGKLTKRQLERCVRGMVGIIDIYHPVLDAAMKRGVVDFSLELSDSSKSSAPGSTNMEQLLRDFQAFLARQGGGDDATKPAGPGLEE